MDLLLKRNGVVMIDLISIHIAKTGGRSFYEILKNQYAEVLDKRYKRVHYFPDNNYQNKLIYRIPNNVKVIHGHLLFEHIEEIYRKYNSKIITWFRDPVERVISNYYFLMLKVREDNNHPHYKKRNYTLLEYANESIRNKMSGYLNGIELEELFFFGFLEDFNTGLKILSSKLEWKKPIEKTHINKSKTNVLLHDVSTKEETITEDMKNIIRELNQDDVALYEKAKILYKKKFCA